MFAEKFLRLVVAGDHNSTYKMATAIALLNVAQEAGDDVTTDRLSTRRLAEVVLDFYWLQAPPRSSDPLRQMNRADLGSEIAEAVRALRTADPTDRALHPPNDGSLYSESVRKVERALLAWPLRLLQRSDDQFVYVVPHPEKRSPAAFGSSFDGQLQLRPGRGDLLRRSAPLLRPLIETEWVRKVARYNGYQLDESLLRRRLFGHARLAWPPGLREALENLQSGCFYCGGRLPRRTALDPVDEEGAATHIDHFVPWALSMNDAMENLVLADGTCNVRKSDNLCAPTVVDRWVARLRQHGPSLERAAEAIRWPSDVKRTVAVALSQYRRYGDGEPATVWTGEHLVSMSVHPAAPVLGRLLNELRSRPG